MKIGISTALMFVAGLLLSGLALGGSHMEGESKMMEHGHMEEGAMMLQTDQISEMQRLLSDRGYNVGQVDGALTAETTEALRQFQMDEGLTVTGTPNAETLRALAPSAEQQEFFGLSPAFGEHAPMMEHGEKEHKKMY